MIWKVMQFEWRMLRADASAILITLMFVLLTGAALWQGMSGLKWRQMAAREFTEAQGGVIARARRAVEEDEARGTAEGDAPVPAAIGPRSPGAVLSRLSEFQVSLPPLSLALLGGDQDELYPTTYKYRLSDGDFAPSLPTSEARALSGLLPERPIDNPLKLMLGPFDLGFIMLYIYPLVILALCFNLLAVERESGALALLLSHPVRLRTLVLGKLAVRATYVFIVAVLLPAVVIYVSQKIIGLETDHIRLMLWMLLVSAYGAFWFSLTVLINARNYGPARNALTLFLGWMVIALMIPALGSLLAQTLFPAPTGATIAEVERVARFETQSSITDVINRIVDDMRNRYPIIEGKEETMERYRRAVYTDLIEVPRESDLLNSFLRRRPEIPRNITPYQLRQIERLARNEYIEQKLAPQLALRHERQKHQQWVITLAGLFSPALTLQKALSEVAGASRIRHNCLLDQLDRHIRSVRDLLMPKIFRNERVRVSDFERIKAFEFVEETNASLVERLMPQFAILIILPLLMSFFAVRSLRRFSAIA
jgi:ABC-2 type transport system permease protein